MRFFYNKILFTVVSNLNGEYVTTLLKGETILSIAVNPPNELYWIRGDNATRAHIELSRPDYPGEKLIHDLPFNSTGLVFDREQKRLLLMSVFTFKV